MTPNPYTHDIIHSAMINELPIFGRGIMLKFSGESTRTNGRKSDPAMPAEKRPIEKASEFHRGSVDPCMSGIVVANSIEVKTNFRVEITRTTKKQILRKLNKV